MRVTAQPKSCEGVDGSDDHFQLSAFRFPFQLSVSSFSTRPMQCGGKMSAGGWGKASSHNSLLEYSLQFMGIASPSMTTGIPCSSSWLAWALLHID